MADRIRVAGMIFEGRVGVTVEERATPQALEIDVALELDLRPAGQSDDLERTVDYSSLYDRVGHIVASGEVRLLEALGDRIATTLLAELPRVEAVEIAIRKPRVRVGRRLESAGIEIRRERRG